MFQFLIGRLSTKIEIFGPATNPKSFNSLQVDYQPFAYSHFCCCYRHVSIPYRQTINQTFDYYRFLYLLGFNSLQVDYQRTLHMLNNYKRKIVSIPYRQTINLMMMSITRLQKNVSIPYRQTINQKNTAVVFWKDELFQFLIGRLSTLPQYILQWHLLGFNSLQVDYQLS